MQTPNDPEYERYRYAPEMRPPRRHPMPPSFSKESVKTQFIILAAAWWIWFLLNIFGVFPEPDFSSPELFMQWKSTKLLRLINISLGITTIVFSFILLHRQWSLLQGFGARTTPGKAVGFCFIPFFNFYWFFVAYAGLATDTNNYLQSAGNKTVRMSYGLAIADCILSILLCLITDIQDAAAKLLLTAGTIIGFIFIVQQRNCVLAIMDVREKAFQKS